MSEQKRGTVLKELAEKYLNDEILPKCIDHLVNGNFRTVEVTILGAVDFLFSDGQIDGAEASDVYSQLGIPPKEMFKIRTGAKLADQETE